jgi:hypothetical protein
MKPSDRFYQVFRSRYGSRTHVTYDTLEELCVDKDGIPLHCYDIYNSIEEIIEIFGDDRAKWPREVSRLIEGGAVGVVRVEPYSEYGYWIDIAKLTDRLKTDLMRTAIEEQDDGSITVVLTEEEAADAVRENRVDVGHGREMETGKALALYGVKATEGNTK